MRKNPRMTRSGMKASFGIGMFQLEQKEGGEGGGIGAPISEDLPLPFQRPSLPPRLSLSSASPSCIVEVLQCLLCCEEELRILIDFHPLFLAGLAPGSSSLSLIITGHNFSLRSRGNLESWVSLIPSTVKGSSFRYFRGDTTIIYVVWV
ncbi:hypothetical protein CRG98_031742 [Punica granatum]|uniref:Uncharacterized protein n=1 Tax=Punica granatum TaxID=22663 RepID=A0A2I0IV56_PUNGR|nr:hypothetical protein CRG98_031742 [Punica granatum]